MIFLKIILPLGWLLEHGTAEVCVTVTEHVEKTYDISGLIN